MLKLLFAIDKSYYFLVVPILHMTVPWVQYRMRAIVPFLCAVAWCFCVNKRETHSIPWFQLKRLKTSVIAAITWFVVYAFSPELNWLFGYGDQIPYHAFAAYVSAIAYIYVAYLSVKKGKYTELRFLAMVGLVGLICAGISASVGISKYGYEGTRSIMSAALEGSSSDLRADAMSMLDVGLGSYRFNYQCASFCGILLIAMVSISDKQVKFLCLAAAIACAIIVRGCGMGTPFFLLFLSVGMAGGYILYRRFKVISVLGCVFFVGLASYIISPKILSPMATALSLVANSMEEGSISVRVKSVVDSLKGDRDAYGNSRFDLHRLSFSTFCDYPIYGVGTYRVPNPKAYLVGGHSELLDIMGQRGIVGLAMFLAMIWSTYIFMREIGRCGLGRAWMVMPSTYIWLYMFTVLANPMPCLPGVFYVVMPGLATYFGDSESSVLRKMQLEMDRGIRER